MINKLFQLIKKYKFNILYAFIFAFLFFVFAPNQEEYYFDFDIEQFKNEYYLNIALTLSTLFIIIQLIVSFLKKYKPIEFLYTILGSILFCFSFFFFYYSIIISSILFVNRKYTVEIVKREYKIEYNREDGQFYAFNLKNKRDIINKGEYLKHPQHKNLKDLKTNDTIKLDFYKGFLGINSIKK